MVQRRCSERRYFLIPRTITGEVFLYVLGLALQRTGVLLHEFNVLGNHYHVVVSDPEGRLPAFEQYLNSLVARALNCSMGRWEAFWSSEPYSAPELLDGGRIIDKCVYTLLNPVEAGLVRYVWDWQGANSWALEYGEIVRVRRPEVFFSESMPEVVELRLTRPADALPELSDRELRAEIRRVVRERQADLVKRMRERGVTFMGMRRVLKQRPTDAPTSHATRRGIRPTVAGRSKWARLEALQRNKVWLATYREALGRYLDGVREAVFPAGTYLMRVRYGVACEPP